MLTRIRKRQLGAVRDVKMPGSKVKGGPGLDPRERGYIAGYTVGDAEGRPGSVLEITLKYAPDRTGPSRASSGSPSSGLAHLRPRRPHPARPRWHGVAVVSTSHGLMTDREHASAISAARCSVMSGDLRRQRADRASSRHEERTDVTNRTIPIPVPTG